MDILLGFLVWLGIAPKVGSPRYGELFLAYMIALMLCLVSTTDSLIWKVKPEAFYFTIGGSFAFFCVVVKSLFRITIRTK